MRGNRYLAPVALSTALLIGLSACDSGSGQADADELTDTASAQSETATVTRIVDGDTVVTSAGTVRVIGIDTPEKGDCGYTEAGANAAEVVVPGSTVALTPVSGKDDTDQYNRLLRYITSSSGVDLGMAQIASGLAIARYDSRDGYGAHPKEARYVAMDLASEPFTCSTPTPTPTLSAAPEPAPTSEPPIATKPPTSAPPAPRTSSPPPAPEPIDPPPPPPPPPADGNPGLPLGPAPGPDLDCKDIGHPVWVGNSDPHGLDRDGDGIGCE